MLLSTKTFNELSNKLMTTVPPKQGAQTLKIISRNVGDTVELSKKKSLTKKIVFAYDLSKLMVGLSVAIVFTAFELLVQKMKEKPELSFETFKKKGGKLDKTKAIYKGKNFTGSITRELGEKTVLIEYNAGLLQKSTISHQDSENRYEIVKEYNYAADENLTDVSVSSRKISLKELAFLSKYSQSERKFIGEENLYTKENLGKVEFTPNEIRCFVASPLTQDVKNRSNLSDKEVGEEAQKILNKIFQGKEDFIPKLRILNGRNEHGGSYSSGTHAIEINANAYRSGAFDLANVVAHEAQHAKHSILRTRLPQNKIEQIVQDVLCSRILNGDADEVIYSGSFFSVDTMKPPKMSEEMRKEFAQFAKNSLYISDKTLTASILNLTAETLENDLDDTQKKFLEKIKEFVDKYPDFVSQFQDKNEAINDLKLYAISHLFRYQEFTRTSQISFVSFDLPKLSPQEEEKAIASVKGHIESIEGNARQGSIINTFMPNEQDYNSYQFSAEEVEAQFAGINFLIAETKQRLENLKKEGKLTSALEQNLNHTIERAEKTIEYKTKGREWYQKYTQLQLQPENAALKDEVEKGKLMLDEMQRQLNGLIPNGTYQRTKSKN